jgi:hypothetical protein
MTAVSVASHGEIVGSDVYILWGVGGHRREKDFALRTVRGTDSKEGNSWSNYRTFKTIIFKRVPVQSPHEQHDTLKMLIKNATKMAM